LSGGGVVLAATAALTAPRAAIAQAPGEVIGWKKFANPTHYFKTSSTTYVRTNMPTNPNFEKLYDDTYLWMVCNIDFTVYAPRVAKMAMFVDDHMVLSIAMGGPPGDILTLSMSELYGKYPAPGIHNSKPVLAGTHRCEVWANVNPGNSVTIRTPVCNFLVMEVALPPMQIG
jgi:hypothetical protein